MNVLMVLGSFEIGGADTTALRLVRCLREAGGYRFTVAPCRREGPLEEAFREAGAAVVAPLGRWSWDPSGVVRAAGLVHGGETDVLLVVDPLRNGLAWSLLGSLASGRRVARVLWCHAPPGGEAGRYAGRVALWRAAGLLDAVVCVSQSQRRELLATPELRRPSRPRGRRCRTPVIPNGIDLARFAAARSAVESDGASGGRRRPTRTVVQVANAGPCKDHDTLLRAAAMLGGRDDVRLLLVGRGTSGPQMRRRVRGLGLAGRVTLAGERQDVPELLAEADIGVLASRAETFGVAVLEYLAAGCAVVATDLPALRELIRSGIEGVLVPPGDPGRLAGAIARLLDDDVLRARLAAAGRRHAKHYGAVRMADRFDRLLRSLLGR